MSSNSSVGVSILKSDTVLPNRVITYGYALEITEVVYEYLSIWREEGFANISQAEWMYIPLRSDWEDKTLKTTRIYFMGVDSRRVIDETFDKLQK